MERLRMNKIDENLMNHIPFQRTNEVILRANEKNLKKTLRNERKCFFFALLNKILAKC